MNDESLDEILAEVDAYARRHGLNLTETAAAAGIPRTTFSGWIRDGERRTPSPAMRARLKSFLREIRSIEGDPAAPSSPPGTEAAATISEGDFDNTARRTRRVRHLLLVLEDELHAFRDGPPSARETFREELDPADVGYIASLLSMLGDESKFARWKQLTTNRFGRFKKKPRNP